MHAPARLVRPRSRDFAGCALALSLALPACGPTTSAESQGDSDSAVSDAGGMSTSASTSAAGSTNAGSTGVDASTDAVDPCADGPTAANGCPCSVLEQTCLHGQKCVQVGWGASADVFCVELPDDPPDVGEPCVFSEQGVDDCAVFATCWTLADDPVTGVCAPSCAADYSCPEGYLCAMDLPTGRYPCLEHCDPLDVLACPQGSVCAPLPNKSLFICLETTGAASPGAACQLSTDCGPGYHCGSAAKSPCEDGLDACCAPLCDLDEPGACDETPMTSCDPWPFVGSTPAPFEHVGSCREL